jgi:hypothetical protein
MQDLHFPFISPECLAPVAREVFVFAPLSLVRRTLHDLKIVAGSEAVELVLPGQSSARMFAAFGVEPTRRVRRFQIACPVESDEMKTTTTIIAPIHAHGPASEIPKANTFLDLVQGTLWLAGIVLIGAALLLIGLLSWPIRAVLRRLQFNKTKL